MEAELTHPLVRHRFSIWLPNKLDPGPYSLLSVSSLHKADGNVTIQKWLMICCGQYEAKDETINLVGCPKSLTLGHTACRNLIAQDTNKFISFSLILLPSISGHPVNRGLLDSLMTGRSFACMICSATRREPSDKLQLEARGSHSSFASKLELDIML